MTYEPSSAAIEAAARAICLDDGNDPDSTINTASKMSAGSDPLPAWMWYQPIASRALIDARRVEDEEAVRAMVAEVEASGGFDPARCKPIEEFPGYRERLVEAARQELAAFMVAHSFSTGHGDTHADLLRELGWQIDEMRAFLRWPVDEALAARRAQFQALAPDAPLPWRHTYASAAISDKNGGLVCRFSMGDHQAESKLAMILHAVNICGGFKAGGANADKE